MFSAISYEARCSKCGETFCPADEDDLIHLVREDGEECGGEADPMSFGAWGVEAPAARMIEVFPARTTPRGRTRPASYLCRFNYPGLLTGREVTVTTIQNPAGALTYTDDDALEAALALLRSLNYDPRVVSATGGA